MITVEKVIESSQNSAKLANEQNEEKLKTGEVKAVKKTYWPWILLILGAAGLGFWLWKKGNNENGTISG